MSHRDDDANAFPPGDPRALSAQLQLECVVMAQHLIASGGWVPSGLIDKLTAQSGADPSCHELVEIHNRLCESVAPAKPRSLLYLAEERARRDMFDFLGEVPLVRRMMALAVASTLTLFCVSLSPLVDGTTQSFSLVTNSGYSLFLHQIFLVSAASIGACFANLYRVRGYVTNGTFDPAFESSYWIRYILGLLAGTLLALLIPVEAWMASLEKSTGEPILQELGKPTLALLGGFSSAAVYRLLDRLVAAIESFVSGDPKDRTAVQEQLWEARLSQRESQVRLDLLQGGGEPPAAKLTPEAASRNGTEPPAPAPAPDASRPASPGEDASPSGPAPDETHPAEC